MGNRLTQEFIEQEFAKEEYQILSTYKNSHTKLNYICPKGHSHSIRWDDWKQGKRCAHCAGRIVANERVQAEFAKAGYTLLSEYRSAKKKLDFICNNGHTHSITWDDWSQGKRCAHCIGRIVTHEQVESEFARAGYTLLSKYSNNEALLDFICDNDHRHQISWGNFGVGKRCAYCAKKRIDHSTVEQKFAEVGYTLLSKYLNKSKQPLEFVCDKGHRHKIRWTDFRRGGRCPYCPNPNVGGFKPSKPAILYYIKFTKKGKSFYKIGITNHSVEKRYASEPLPYEVLLEKTFLIGSLAQSEESQILRKYARYLYKDTDVLMSGNTELFTKDVLNLDTKIALSARAK